MSKRVTMKMHEVVALRRDLSQLLSEKLKLTAKMDVSGLLRTLNPIVEEYDKLVLEFYKTHGEEKEDGSYVLKKDISKALKKELEDLAEKEESFVSALKFDSFKDIETDKAYYTFFMLFSDSSEEKNKTEKTKNGKAK